MLTEQATARFSSDQLFGRLEVGSRQSVGGLAVTPFAAVQFVHLWQPGFTESSVIAGGGPGVLGWDDLVEQHGADYLKFPREFIWLGGAPGAGKGTNTPFIADLRGIANLESNLGLIHHYRSDLRGARPRYEAALALFTRCGDRRDRGQILYKLGDLLHNEGDLLAARAVGEQALSLFWLIGDTGERKRALWLIVSGLFEGGDLRRAAHRLDLAEPLHDALAPLAGKIIAAFVYGSIAKRADTATSDIDLMVISDTVSYAELFKLLEPINAVMSRAVNPTLYTQKDFLKRRKGRNSFVTRVLSQPKVWI